MGGSNARSGEGRGRRGRRGRRSRGSRRAATPQPIRSSTAIRARATGPAGPRPITPDPPGVELGPGQRGVEGDPEVPELGRAAGVRVDRQRGEPEPRQRDRRGPAVEARPVDRLAARPPGAPTRTTSGTRRDGPAPSGTTRTPAGPGPPTVQSRSLDGQAAGPRPAPDPRTSGGPAWRAGGSSARATPSPERRRGGLPARPVLRERERLRGLGRRPGRRPAARRPSRTHGAADRAAQAWAGPRRGRSWR